MHIVNIIDYLSADDIDHLTQNVGICRRGHLSFIKFPFFYFTTRLISATSTTMILRVRVATYVYVVNDDEDDEIAYFTVRWKTRAILVYRTKNMR